MNFFKKNEGVLLRFDDEESNFSMVFDDNGRVAYGYLLENDEIISEVWLYNVCKTPDHPEWGSHRKMPFANSKEFVSQSMVEPASDDNDVHVVWQHENSQFLSCGIYLREELLGTLSPGSKPGYAAMALKDGPLAHALFLETE